MTSTALPLENPSLPICAERLEAIVGLGIIDGLGSKTVHRMMLQAENPEEIWKASAAWFKAIPNEILSQKMALQAFEAIQSAQRDELAVRCVDQLLANEIHVLTSPKYGWSKGKAYPTLLSHIADPPWLLFLKAGHSSLLSPTLAYQQLSGKTIAVVGTRRMSDYGRRVVSHLLEGMVPARPTIVSGLAEGVDGAAHADALRLGLPTVAVFGCGIDKIFPSAHQALARDILDAGGVWVSEYPPGMPGHKWSFPKRNRIIVGLSHGVVVVEGPQKSGSMITARLAIEEDRAVFAPPGNIFNPLSEGPHSLIQQGAVPVIHGQDILDELQWGVMDAPAVTLSDETTAQLGLVVPSDLGSGGTSDNDALLAHIGYDPTPLDVVRQRSGLSIMDLQTRLTLLELTGEIVQLPGQRVSRR